MRTTKKNVTFSQPFTLLGIDGVLAPGSYEIDTDDEPIAGITRIAFHRTATTIRIERDGTVQIHRIDPVELEAALLKDSGQTIVASGGT